MNRLTGWQWLGILGMATGVWAIAWGLWHWNEVAMPGPRGASLQWSRVLGGITLVVLGSLFYRRLAP